MKLIQEHSLLIIAILLVLLIISVLFYFLRERNSRDDSSGISRRGSVSKEKFNLVFNQRNEESQEKVKFENLYNDYREKYEKACVEIGKLKSRIDELTRDYNELSELYNKDTAPYDVDEKSEGANPIVDHSLESETTQGAIVGQKIKYASFPRSAGNTIYFSDLTDKLVDDSYFEIRLSGDTDKASFRPLDFMKIRNYDPAMAAILTDGVKPNVASTVLGVEPGDVCLEGNDWIIKKLAKVKLA